MTTSSIAQDPKTRTAEQLPLAGDKQQQRAAYAELLRELREYEREKQRAADRARRVLNALPPRANANELSAAKAREALLQALWDFDDSPVASAVTALLQLPNGIDADAYADATAILAGRSWTLDDSRDHQPDGDHTLRL